MKLLQEGFLLIEILVSFLCITTFVIICMRYHAQSLALKEQSLSVIHAVNQLEEILDQFEKEKQLPCIANRKFKLSYVIQPVAIPAVQGGPANFSLRTIKLMKHAMMSLTWVSKSGPHRCSLSLIFKDTHEIN